MTKIKIVTDSTVDLTDEEIEKYNITIVPLSSLIGDQNYNDGVDITRTEFLEKMLASEKLPMTSQPSTGAFTSIYEELTSDGSEVLSIHLGNYFSGTYNNALQAANQVVGKVVVLDSEFVARALAFQVLEAARLAEKGLPMEDIVNTLTKVRKNTHLYVTVVNLENIIKGGRISQFVGGISSFLKIKLNFQLVDNDLKMMNKVRGNKGILKHYSEVIESFKDKNVVKIGFTHSSISDCSRVILNDLKTTFPNAELLVMYASSTIMVHTGKDAFSVQFLVED